MIRDLCTARSSDNAGLLMRVEGMPAAILTQRAATRDLAAEARCHRAVDGHDRDTSTKRACPPSRSNGPTGTPLDFRLQRIRPWRFSLDEPSLAHGALFVPI